MEIDTQNGGDYGMHRTTLKNAAVCGSAVESCIHFHLVHSHLNQKSIK